MVKNSSFRFGGDSSLGVRMGDPALKAGSPFFYVSMLSKRNMEKFLMRAQG